MKVLKIIGSVLAIVIIAALSVGIIVPSYDYQTSVRLTLLLKNAGRRFMIPDK